jgi:thiol-disulfide isomerase/thioredoxin
MKKKSNMESKKRTSSRKKELYQWLGIGVVIAVLYFTGLHTSVIAGMQRVMLFTGLFNAQVTQTAEGSEILNPADYNFEMMTNQGNRISLDEFSGKVTFINVWASWCPPCIAEMPTIETLNNHLEGNEDIRFIMLSLDEDRDKSVQFMKNYSMPYHFPESGIPESLQSSVLPTTYVISKEGEIVYKKEGIADYSSRKFREWLVELTE